MGIVTNPADLDKMRAACQAAASILDYIGPFIKPGITTAQINDLCHERMKEIG